MSVVLVCCLTAAKSLLVVRSVRISLTGKPEHGSMRSDQYPSAFKCLTMKPPILRNCTRLVSCRARRSYIIKQSILLIFYLLPHTCEVHTRRLPRWNYQQVVRVRFEQVWKYLAKILIERLGAAVNTVFNMIFFNIFRGL